MPPETVPDQTRPVFGSGPGAASITVGAGNDVTVYSPPLRGFYVGSAGDVTIVDAYGNSALYKSVPQGSIIPAVAQKIMASGTTASLIIGFQD